MNDDLKNFLDTVDRWEAKSRSKKKWAEDEEAIDLLTDAQILGREVPAYAWAKLAQVLPKATTWDSATCNAEVTNARLAADLGERPYTYGDFVRCFVTARGLAPRLDGTFVEGGAERPADEVFSRMKAWTGDNNEFTRAMPLIAAWDCYKRETHRQLLLDCYERVKFDPQADAGMLDGFINRMCKNPEDRRVMRAVVATFIYRVKNHMRGRFYDTCHIMPYWNGRQGSGKTRASKWFFAPVEDAVLPTDFSIFEDKSQMVDFTKMPIAFFDEMAFANRQEAGRVKGMMTGAKRQFRQLYCEASKSTIIATFWGCGNFPIADLFRDTSGLRRFFEAMTPRNIDLAGLLRLDALQLWQSVDENAAEPPIFAEPGLYAELERLQDAQRDTTASERWLRDAVAGRFVAQSTVEQQTIGAFPYGTWLRLEQEIFPHFHAWLEVFEPGEAKRASAVRFGRQLTALLAQDDTAFPSVTKRVGAGGAQYCIAVAATQEGRQPSTEGGSPKPATTNVASLTDVIARRRRD